MTGQGREHRDHGCDSAERATVVSDWKSVVLVRYLLVPFDRSHSPIDIAGRLGRPS